MNAEIARRVHVHADAPRRVVFFGDDLGVMSLLWADDPDELDSIAVVPLGPLRGDGPVDLGAQDPASDRLPLLDASSDVVVCNQWFMRITHVRHAMTEAWRILRPRGLLVVSVANLSALHNCVLLALGRQPTTIDLDGTHLRGFAPWSASDFLRHHGRFRVLGWTGVGLHPFSSRVMPWPLKIYSQTTVWALQKEVGAADPGDRDPPRRS
jgi:SAM-dependent methyltransferase